MHPKHMGGCWQLEIYQVTEREYLELRCALVDALIGMAQGCALPGGESLASRMSGRGEVYGRLADELLAEAEVEVAR
jgi:hypothetical protein